MAKRGRPTKAAKPGTKASLGLKVTAALKARLESAAEESGRTQSQEAEHRLERSFERENGLLEVLDLAYGPHISGLVQLIGDTVVRIAASTSAISIISNDKTRAELNFNNCLRDPWTFKEIERTIAILLAFLRPDGEAKPPSLIADAVHDGRIPMFGEKYGEDMIELLKDPGEDRISWAAENLKDILERKARA